MYLPDLAVRRPVFTTMAVLALVVFGLVSYPGLAVDLFPDVDFPIVNVLTTLEGADPEIMESDVTDKIEEAVNTLQGVKNLFSVSAPGVSVVTVEFELERDIDVAAQEVREKISGIRSLLPQDMDEPVIEKVDPDAQPIMWIAAYGDRPKREISRYADKVLKERLQKVRGVGQVLLAGYQEREVRIWLHADRLQAYQLTAADVVQALRTQHVELPSGRIESRTQEFLVKTMGEFETAEAFNQLIVAHRSGTPVRLKEIGYAEDGVEEKRSISRFNGLPSVGLGIRKQSGTNTVEVIHSVKEALEKLRPALPPGIQATPAFDQSVFIRRSINLVQEHLVLGGLLAVLVIFFYLRSFRSTLIAAVALPTSIIATFAFMQAMGFSLNNMTMLGVSLVVGILIDDAIVVLENIYRHMEGGEAPRSAASTATAEIGLAVMAITATIMAVFIPVAFMKGIVGRFFYEFALVVAFAVGVSLLVSLTMTPMLSSRFLGVTHKHGRLYEAIERALQAVYGAYRPLLALALRHRALTVGAGLAAFALALVLTFFIGKEFLPPEDQGRFIVRMEAPKDASIDAADAMFQQVDDLVRKHPAIATAFYAVGFGAERDITKGLMFVGMKERWERDKSQQEVMADLRTAFKQVPGVQATAEQISLIGGGQRMVPIQFNIKGPDLEKLQAYTRVIIDRFSKVPGVVDLDTDYETGKPEVRVHIDREKASDMGVAVAPIASTIRTLIGGEPVAKFRSEGERYDVRVRLVPQDRAEPDAIRRLYVRSPQGSLVRMENVVDIEERSGPAVILRKDRERKITLFANLEGTPLGTAIDALNAITREVLPAGYTTSYTGIGEAMGESFFYLALALGLGLVMMYMIMASQFESFLHPFTIMLSVPLSLIGGFGALWLTGMTINIFSLIGVIMLMGLVTKNAILLVDFTNTLRQRGMERNEAVLTAGPIRLRPILMTTSAMIFGMLPIALGVGEGAEVRAPMAVTVIGGLLTSMFLTLVVIPVVYTLFDDLILRLKTRWASMRGR